MRMIAQSKRLERNRVPIVKVTFNLLEIRWSQTQFLLKKTKESESRAKDDDEDKNVEITEDKTENYADSFEDALLTGVFDLFFKLVKFQKQDSCESKRRGMLDAMKSMSMVKREKGDTSSLQKVKSLITRWHDVKKQKVEDKSEGMSIIKRRSVVKIQNDNRIFIVHEV